MITYEVSTKGDRRFSALVATLFDGRTIEEAYQLDVKGYRAVSSDWRTGKGKRPLRNLDLWTEYLALWMTWAEQNPDLIEHLDELCPIDCRLTDTFSHGKPISQANALSVILDRYRNGELY